jgi:hypothetical protein
VTAAPGAQPRRPDADGVVHDEGACRGRAVAGLGAEGVLAVVAPGQRLPTRLEFKLVRPLRRRVACDLDAGVRRARTHGHDHHAESHGRRAPAAIEVGRVRFGLSARDAEVNLAGLCGRVDGKLSHWAVGRIGIISLRYCAVDRRRQGLGSRAAHGDLGIAGRLVQVHKRCGPF